MNHQIHKGNIIFFDATEARRNRMKNASARTSGNIGKAVPEISSMPVVKPVVSEEIIPAERKMEILPDKPAIVDSSISTEIVADISINDLDQYLINFVVEQTGYPEDMIDLDADLEGDLGIDSIKKAQLLGELNEMFHFAGSDATSSESTLTLDDFPTLRTIRDYMLQKMGSSSSDSKEGSVAAKVEVEEPEETEISSISSVSSSDLDGYLINFVVEQTGYPEDMIDLDADLEGDLGIDSIKKAQLLGELNEMFHFAGSDATSSESTLTLDDFPTLRTIRDYMLQKMGSSSSVSKEGSVAAKVEVEEPEGTEISSLSSVSSSELDGYLINFVVEQTGYPEDMIDLDADLEGDLGIDSIKKAQLLGELNEMFHFAGSDATSSESTLTLDDFPTLRTIRDYMLQKMGSSSSDSKEGSVVAKVEVEEPEETEISSLSSVSSSDLDGYLINFVVEQTGYPEDMIDLDADLEGDLGIDSIKKAQLLGELNEMFHFAGSDATSSESTLTLDDFPTLRTIRDYMLQKMGSSSVSKEESVAAKVEVEEPEETEISSLSSVSSSDLDGYLINFVVEQTGYPEDMIDLDADLEGDLGIDSIKKAQLLGELNEMFHFAGSDATSSESTLTLDDFPTLRTIRDYMLQKLGSSSQNSEKADTIKQYIINFVIDQTGYPKEMIDFDANLEMVLGIESIKKAQLLGELSDNFQVFPLENAYLSDFTTLKQIQDAIEKELS